MVTTKGGAAGARQADSLRGAGEQIASFAGSQLGAGPSRAQLAAQRARLVGWEQRRHVKANILKPLLWGGGLATAAAILLVWSFGLSERGPLTKSDVAERQRANFAAVEAEVQPIATASGPGGAKAGPLHAMLNGRALLADAWVNSEAGPLSVEFSDSSQVSLAEGARARLTELSPDAVLFTVESGELTASVTPGGRHEWAFRAGPYTVTVLGTVLRVAWEPESEVLSVAVSRGKVSVSGGSIEAERTVAAGESFSVSPPVPSSNRGHSARAQGTRQPAGAPSESATSTPKSEASDGVRAPVVPEVSAPESWKVLAERGEYKKALQAAQQQGMTTLVERANAADLLLLADTARLAGAMGQASSVLHGLRRRYSGHPNAQVAAFTLGRMAYDTGHDDKAVHWFRTYLRESPAGPLAGAARGRLMLSLSRLGDRAGAAAAAKIYLSRHPRGPHAGVARSLLSKP